jgi:hypothetical protein
MECEEEVFRLVPDNSKHFEGNHFEALNEAENGNAEADQEDLFSKVVCKNENKE